MRVGVPKETAGGEQRVALVPDAVSRLEGFGVVVERGAGEAAGFPDAAYAEAGAELADEVWTGADAVVKVAGPSESEIARLSSGEVLVAFLQPLTETARIDALRQAGVLAFAMESIPRTTRAQAMDALSSQATVAGYKAVLIGADRLPRFLPMLTTAAGTIPPARVLVLGAGVAGLQAIATARRLGGVVSGFDVRPAVREQVQSLGASFLDLGVVGEEGEGGYARELSPEEQARQQAALEERIPDFDLVITTAAIPGRPAPRLIPASAVENMRPGSVIVDLAAETGGNCELTRPGEVVSAHGVTVVGLLNLPSAMPGHASQLYSRNVSALLEHLAPAGELTLDWSDEITAGACVTRPPGDESEAP
jgi:H+-translocating NAD(P) transhydrogenase subunit alpha